MAIACMMLILVSSSTGRVPIVSWEVKMAGVKIGRWVF